jgi:hypothetical protein
MKLLKALFVFLTLLNFNSTFSQGLAFYHSPTEQVINFTFENPIQCIDQYDVLGAQIVTESYSWNFGDGSTTISSSPTIIHEYYPLVSNYDVTVTANFTYTINTGADLINGTCSVNSFLGFKTLFVPIDSVALLCPTVNIINYVWCNAGVLTIQAAPTYNDINGSSYWNLDQIVWNMGDGETEITNSFTENLVHEYSVTDSVVVSALAYFTGINGESCIVPVSINVNDEVLYQLDLAPYYFNVSLFSTNDDYCTDGLISIYNNILSFPVIQNNLEWSYSVLVDGVGLGNGGSATIIPGLQNFSTPVYSGTLPVGQHVIEVIYYYKGITNCQVSSSISIEVVVCDPCVSCNTFQPNPGKRYWASAWVKEEHLNQVKNYTNSYLEIEFIGVSGVISSAILNPSGDIIEGWQRIVGDFIVPAGTTELNINLVKNGSLQTAYFDDIRIHPFNASMKSYVYDPETLWLTAELDDNNYATFYEYDKEGQLIRIKKETARGIMTIQESRSSNPKEN